MVLRQGPAGCVESIGWRKRLCDFLSEQRSPSRGRRCAKRHTLLRNRMRHREPVGMQRKVAPVQFPYGAIPEISEDRMPLRRKLYANLVFPACLQLH